MSVTFSGVLRYDNNGKIPGERYSQQPSSIFLQWITSVEMKLAFYGKGFCQRGVQTGFCFGGREFDF